MCEKVAKDGPVEAGNTRDSGDECPKFRREETHFVDGDMVVVGELVECQEGSDNDLMRRIKIGSGGALDEVVEPRDVGFNDHIKSS